MNRLSRVAAAGARALTWLLPAGRRNWAEAHDVPPGLARLAWRAGPGCLSPAIATQPAPTMRRMRSRLER